MKPIPFIIIKQILLLIVIAFLAYLLFVNLSFLIPGFLFAITLYTLLKKWYCQLVYDKKLKKWMSAMLVLLLSMLVIAIPIGACIKLLLPKINTLMLNSNTLQTQILQITSKASEVLPQGYELNKLLQNAGTMVAQKIPSYFNETLNIFTNIVIGYFIVYFMLVNITEFEKMISKLLPVNPLNQKLLKKETKNIVVSNAIGIPILAMAQGIIAYIGFIIWDVPQPAFWGVLTCFFSFVPLVGTLVIWVPLCMYLYAIGHGMDAWYLGIYCLVLLTNVDNLLRFTVLKKLGDVHPLITIFGVIIGLNIFGFLGLIFGPLLIAYFVLLVKIFYEEYGLG